MIPREALEFVKKTQDLRGLKRIILFGSYAKDEYTNASDIDVLLIFDRDPKKLGVLDQVKEVERRIEGESKRNLELVITSDLKEMDPTFRNEIETHGIVLLDRPRLKTELERVSIFSFDLRNLTIPDKHRFKRAFYGDKNFKGVVERVNGLRLGRGCVLVKESFGKDVENVLKRFNANYSRLHTQINVEELKRIKSKKSE